ncbi:hypothetical protein FKR81_08175 [Lentzea tibetensis]|uniref:PPE family protein n=1 Tax=Lentzea tibetensis TaxID=2591470 RepID=A0A563EZK3_9PSEU|nr:hypothetical protein [Lentzea tibetensis]TWP53053.1 hypothetical protein FKR81_08175 [Lentzea tibetensis]
MSNESFGDARYAGYDNAGLANLIEGFRASGGARVFGEASAALRELSLQLEKTDDDLRRELGKLNISWQGLAGDNAGQSVEASAKHGGDSSDAAKQNAQATMMQSEANSQARNTMPESQKLRGATSTGIVDDVAGFFGHETDRAKEVKETNAARQQAIDSLNGYSQNSQDAINRFQDPGRPPNFEVTSTSSVSTPVGHTQQPGVGTPGFHGTPGTPGSTGLPPGTGGNPVGPVPNVPGGTTGTLPGTPPPGAIPPGPGLPGKLGSPLPVGLGIATAAAAGLGAAAATARPGQTVGGGRGPSQAPKTPIAPAGPKGAPSTIGAGGTGTGSGTTKGGAAGVGAADEHGPNRPGAKGGAGVAGKGGSGLMSPAAGAAKGEGDEDEEHVRKYGVDSDDVFGDERMVVQSVIGEDPKDK